MPIHAILGTNSAAGVTIVLNDALNIGANALTCGAITAAGVAKINGPGSVLFSDALDVGGGIYLAASNPALRFDDQGQAADNRLFDISNTGNQLVIRTMNNAGTVSSNAMVVDRTGTTIDSVTFPNGTVSMGALTTNGGLQTFGANDSAGAGYRTVRVPNA